MRAVGGIGKNWDAKARRAWGGAGKNWDAKARRRKGAKGFGRDGTVVGSRLGHLGIGLKLTFPAPHILHIPKLLYFAPLRHCAIASQFSLMPAR